jgi:hypothetical protein
MCRLWQEVKGIEGRVQRRRFPEGGEKKLPELMKPTSGSHLSLVEEEERLPFWDFGRAGRGPIPKLGRMASPGPFSYFLISFLLFYFLISDLFPNLLQTCFNSNQTNS